LIFGFTRLEWVGSKRSGQTGSLGAVTKITDTLLDEVSAKAKVSERRRCNHNFHASSRDPIQRFLNAVEPGTYVRPHKHETPPKTEVFIILRGRVLILEFEDQGEITDHTILDPARGMLGVEIPPKTWHTFIALQEGSILYEMKPGPFNNETDKVFAEWAPEEGSQESDEFNKRIVRGLGIPFH
jgi:cupin fold WbuC family metalloprotein